MTFVIGRGGRIRHCIADEQRFGIHADEALAAIERHGAAA
jgi:peroxiredoxin